MRNKNRNEFLQTGHVGRDVSDSVVLGILREDLVIANHVVSEERLFVVYQRDVPQQLRKHGHSGDERHRRKRKRQRRWKRKRHSRGSRDRVQECRVRDSDRRGQHRGQVHRAV